MTILKKLFTLPLIVLFWFLTLHQLKELTGSLYTVYSINSITLIKLLTISMLILLTSISIVIFISLSSDIIFSLCLAIVLAMIPFALFSVNLATILGVGGFLSVLLAHLLVANKLRDYLTFQPTVLFGSAVRNLSSLLILSFAVAYLIMARQEITQKGIVLPESFITTVSKLTEQQAGPGQNMNIKLTDEDIALLKQNPELLRKYGLDPSIIDSLTQSSSGGEIPIQALVRNKLESLLQPYKNVIPYVLGLLFYLTIYSFYSLFALFTTPILWLTYKLMEALDIISFEIETREVKKNGREVNYHYNN